MKKSQIAIIVSVTIVTIICVIFAIIYFTTSVFKSDKVTKEEVNGYIAQMNLKEYFVENEQVNYATRLKENAHSIEGDISIKLDVAGMFEVDEGVEYIGQVDPSKKIANTKIDIIQEGENVLTLDYLRNEDLYGIKFEEIVKQYIVVENNNLKDFAAKLGVEDTSEIPNKIDINEIQALSNQDIDITEIIPSEEEINQILNRYIPIIMEQIPEERYSKLEKQTITVGDQEIKVDGYKITANLKDLQNILIKVLETAKEDKQIYDMLIDIISITGEDLEDFTFEYYKEEIQSAIDEISEELEENPNLVSIFIYKQEENTVKIHIKLGEEGKETESYSEISLEKVQDKLIIKLNGINNTGSEKVETSFTINKTKSNNEQDTCEISFNTKQDDKEILNGTITATRNGNLAGQQIENNIKVSAEILGMANLDIEYNNKVDFDAEINIPEFVEGDYAILNNYSGEQITNVLTNVVERISEKVDFEKTIIYNLVSSIIQTNDSLLSNAQEAVDDFNNAAQEEANLSDTEEQTMNQATRIFNSQFTAYEGIQRGTTVRQLILTITANNQSQPEHVVECEEDTTTINTSKQYEISFERDSQGYINKVIIEEQ